MARCAASGHEVFRVALPAGDFDTLPIVEATGLFVVRAWDDPGGAGASLLIDRAGQVRYRLNRQVVALIAAGEDRLALTSGEVTRLGAGSQPGWTTRFPDAEWIAGGGLVKLAGADVVAYLYCRIGDSGVRVLRLDPGTGRKRWETRCLALGMMHSEYHHDAVVEVGDGQLTVTSTGSGGTFVEALDAKTGHPVARRASRSDEAPWSERGHAGERCMALVALASSDR